MRLLRPFLAALLAVLLIPAAGMAKEIPLSAISAYLNGLTTAEASFSQRNGDGSVSTGKLFIDRPGRMRFEYDPPNKALVIAGSGAVAIFDPKSNQPPEQYPLARTPLNLILARHIDLGQAQMVVSHRAEGDRTVVVAQDPKHPDYGQIALYFSADPLRLDGWAITDQSGGQTAVRLAPLKTGLTFGSALFDIKAEAEARRGR
jgi:outer membrane lipoprotein-sorting protein